MSYAGTSPRNTSAATAISAPLLPRVTSRFIQRDARSSHHVHCTHRDIVLPRHLHFLWECLPKGGSSTMVNKTST